VTPDETIQYSELEVDEPSYNLRNWDLHDSESSVEQIGKKTVHSIVKELLQMNDRNVWTGVNLRDLTYKQKKKKISSSMFLKDKYHPDGTFEKIKAR
jgi:hypothetical protein